MVETIHELTVRSGAWQQTTELVGKLNRALRGWANHFRVGSVTKAYRALDNYTAVRLAPVVALQAQGSAMQGWDLSPLAPLRALWSRTSDGRNEPWAKTYVLSESRMEEICASSCDYALGTG
jgi:RNA-directed DNA polymerase